MEERHPIKLSITFRNDFGCVFSQSSEHLNSPYSFESELDTIGEDFNRFLSLIGYRRANGYMLMEDLTYEELEAVTLYLDELRNKNKESEDDYT